MAPRHAFGPFVFEPGRGLLRNGEPIAIGHRGMALLEALLDADGQPVAKATLFEWAWPGTIVEEVNLSVQIAALRKALGRDADGREWITTVPRVGYCLPRQRETSQARTGVRRATIVVLPFRNMSSDPEQDYFANGVVEDLITALSGFKSFAVVARSSSFAYKGRAADVRVVAEELGVRYVLEGSVQRRGERVRVTAQLIEGETGLHLWAESLDGELENLFDFQDRITEAVVGLIEPEILKAEIERSKRRRPENLDAYDLLLRAMPLFHHFGDGRALDEAIVFLEEAVAREPDFALALAYAAWAYERRDSFARPLEATEHRRCLELAKRALELGGDDPQIGAIGGLVLLIIGNDHAAGIATAQRALEANPNNSVVLSLAAICDILAGDLDRGIAAYHRGYQLSPGSPDSYVFLSGIGFGHFFKRDFDTALDWLRRAQDAKSGYPPILWTLTAAYAHLGRMDEARATLLDLRRAAPYLDLDRVAYLGKRSDGRFNLTIEGLRRAGLPETIVQ